MQSPYLNDGGDGSGTEFSAKPRVLVVDDEKVLRHICRASLERENYQVATAENGLAALDQLEDFKDIGIVITDLKMPGKDGIELLADIKRDYPHIEVIIMTGFATVQNAIEAMKKGAWDIILKPVKPDQISMVTNKCFEKIRDSKTIAGLREANRRLQSLESMKSKFLAITSHELRTPVSHLKGFLSIMNDEIADSMSQEERDECMRVVLSAVDDLEEIVNNMFDLVRVENERIPVNLEEIDLNDVLRDVHREFSLLSAEDKRGQILKLELEAQQSKFMADRLKVKVIMSHIVQNAKKFTPDGGEITIRSYDQDEFYVAAVRDNGIGIPESQLGNIFSPFLELGNTDHHSTGKNTFGGGGLGLGLSLAKAFARAHGGWINVESEEGKGSEFSVLLPRNPETDEESAA